MWLANRWLITKGRGSWMRRSTITTCTNKVRTPVHSLGPLPSSSRPRWPGLGTRPSLRCRQGPRGPPEVGRKPKTIRTWSTCWTSSCEESELHSRVTKFVICFIFDITIVATYPFAGERGEAHGCVFHRRKMRGVATNVYWKENVRKTKGNRSWRIFQIQELSLRLRKVLAPFTFVPKDNNLRLELCEIMYLNFYFFFIFEVDKSGALTLTYPPSKRKSDLRSVEAKLHGESKVIQRCFDDNNDDNKRWWQKAQRSIKEQLK